MQLYARNSEDKKISVHSAERGKDYFCLECSSRMRVRMGRSLKAHFYHLSSEKNCRQAGKSEEHLFLQKFIQQQIGTYETVEEMRFPEIQRVADVAWPEKKCVFEVQCSPIREEVAIQRTLDYESIGWNVIWILHEKSFNNYRLTGLELFLQTRTHYFTDGQRMYDQLHVVQAEKRKFGSKKVFVNIAAIEPFLPQKKKMGHPEALHVRAAYWKYSAEGDHLWMGYTQPDDAWQENMRRLIKVEARQRRGAIFQPLFAHLRAFWHFILERSCQ